MVVAYCQTNPFDHQQMVIANASHGSLYFIKMPREHTKVYPKDMGRGVAMGYNHRQSLELQMHFGCSPAIGAQPGFTGQGPEVGHGMAVGPHVGIDQLSLHALPSTWEVVRSSKKGCWKLDVGKVGDWRYWDIR